MCICIGTRAILRGLLYGGLDFSTRCTFIEEELDRLCKEKFGNDPKGDSSFSMDKSDACEAPATLDRSMNVLHLNNEVTGEIIFMDCLK